MLFADVLISLIWKILPQVWREGISARVRAIEERSSRVVPSSDVSVYSQDPSVRKIFAQWNPIDAWERESYPGYTLITTCKNEAGCIEQWIESVEAQSVLPSQLIIVDGGSTDGTVELINEWIDKRNSRQQSTGKVEFEVDFILGHGLNISQGRNIAAAHVKHEFIVFSDVGSLLDENWARALMVPLTGERGVEVSMGWWAPQAETALSRGVAALVAPSLDEINPEVFLPSGRSLAMRRDVFEKTGGYPEFLTLAGEDTLFDICLKTTAKHFAFCPEALVSWTLPSTAPALYRMVFNYARGDAEMGETSWGHYHWVLRQGLGVAIELATLVVALLTLSGDWKVLFLLLSGCSLVVRLFGISKRFLSRFAGVKHSIPLAAVFLVYFAQLRGFWQGLQNREAVEAERRREQPKGVAIFFCKNQPYYSDDVVQAEAASRIDELIQEGWFVSCICDALDVGKPFLRRYSLDLFSVDSVDPKLWHKTYVPHISEGDKILKIVIATDSARAEHLAKELQNVIVGA